MTPLVIGCQLQRGPVGQRVVTAHFEIVGALRPGAESGRVIRVGLVVPWRFTLVKRDLLDIRRREQPAIVGMKDVRLIQLVRDADAWTDLPFIVEALNLMSYRTPRLRVQWSVGLH